MTGGPQNHGAVQGIKRDATRDGITLQDLCLEARVNVAQFHRMVAGERNCDDAQLGRLEDALRHLRNRPSTDRGKERKCLGCQTPFWSTWAGHRLCDNCKTRTGKGLVIAEGSCGHRVGASGQRALGQAIRRSR